MSTIDDLMAKRDRLFGKGATTFYATPVHLVRGEGVWLWDADGRRYLDMYNNVPVVGHANPRVVDAVSRQLATHTVHSRYVDAHILDYAERLLALHDDAIENVVFACSGTEANEIAMQMARLATGGTGFICTNATYHGNSALVGSLTRAPRRGRPDVHAVPFPDLYRSVVDGASETELADAYVAEVQAAIDDFAAEGTKLAGIILCSLLANEGLPHVPAGVVRRMTDAVRAAGGVVIMDEVQSGFCRSGQWWGYQVMDVVPDITTMGKPMGNGLPLAACAGRRDIVERFRAERRYFNTFAGSPLQAAAGLAVLDEIEGRELAANATAVGDHLHRALADLTRDVDAVGEIRQRGLFLGLEWVTDRASRTPDAAGAVRVANLLKDEGVLVSNAGAHGATVKIRPPLVFEREHADVFLQAFAEVLHQPHA